MSDSAAVGRIIFRSRLISALLLLIAVGCFFVMAMLAEPSKTAAPAPEPVKTSPKGASKEANNKDTNSKDAPTTSVSSQDLSEQIKARLSAADYFDTEFYQSLNALQSRLSALNLPETGQAQKQLSALQELEKRLVPIRGLSP